MVDDTTVLTPTIPAPGAVELELRIEPRAWANGAPVWDATDEIYIIYDQEGHRASTTQENRQAWDEEWQYQEAGNGSPRYEALRGLGGHEDAPGVRRIRPEWYVGETGESPPVYVDRAGHDTGDGSGPGTGTDPQERRGSAARVVPEVGDLSDRRSVPIRSHRHCPGCTGHSNTRGGWVWIVARVVGSFFIGYTAIWTAHIGVDFAQYVVLSCFGLIALALIQPAWREYVNDRDRQAKGGVL
jgi:hypothetical protein